MNGFLGQVFTVLFGRGVIRIAQFVSLLILARVLTPTEFGWFGIITTAIALSAVLGSLGLRQSFSYQIGQGRLTPAEAVGTALVLWPVLAAVAAMVVAVLYAGAVDGVDSGLMIALIAVGVSVTILHTLLQGVFLGKGQIWAFSLSEAIPRIALMIGVAVLAALATLSLATALWVHVIGFAIALPVMVWLSLGASGQVRTAMSKVRSMLGYGLIFALNLFLVQLCARLSMFVIESVQGADAAGQFFAAVRVAEIFLESATALGLVLFSRASRESDTDSTIKRGVRVASGVFWLFLAVSVFVAICAPWVVSVLLGEAYSGATIALQILALGLAPMAASKIIYSSLAGAGRPHFGTPVLLSSLLINLTVAVLLVPPLGVAGGAIALVIGQYALHAGYALTCRSRYGVALKEFVLPPVSLFRSISLRVIFRRWWPRGGRDDRGDGGLQT